VERSELWEMSPASSTPSYQMMTHIVGTEVGGQPQDCGEVRILGNESRLAEVASKILLHIQVQVVCSSNFSLKKITVPTMKKLNIGLATQDL